MLIRVIIFMLLYVFAFREQWALLPFILIAGLQCESVQYFIVALMKNDNNR